jgi:ribosomal protein L32
MSSPLKDQHPFYHAFQRKNSRDNEKERFRRSWGELDKCSVCGLNKKTHHLSKNPKHEFTPADSPR